MISVPSTIKYSLCFLIAISTITPDKAIRIKLIVEIIGVFIATEASVISIFSLMKKLSMPVSVFNRVDESRIDEISISKSTKDGSFCFMDFASPVATLAFLHSRTSLAA